MKNRSVLFSVCISFFIAFIFLTLVSLELHNRGIHSKEVQLEDKIHVIKNFEDKDKILQYLKYLTRDQEEGDIFVLLEGNKIIYTNTFKKSTKELVEFINSNEKVYNHETSKDVLHLKSLEANFFQTQRLKGDLFFIGGYKTQSMLGITLHFLPYFILSGAIGSFLLYVLSAYILERNKSETKYLIRSFKNFVRDPEFKMEQSSYIELFNPDIRREARDVRRKIESLESRLNGLNDMIVNMTEGVILVGKDRKIISINEAAVKLVDASIHINYQGKDLLYLCREMNFYKTFSNAFDKSIVSVNKIKLGEKIVKIFLNPVFTIEKEFFGMMLLLIDDTASTMAERQRREFTSNVTHELKTPLTSIKGYAELLRTGSVNGTDQVKFLDIILTESQRLFELIDAIISMSRLEEKNKIEEYEVVDIYSVIKDIFAAHKAEIQPKNLKVTILPAIENKLYTHPNIIREILWNLINNAVVYNEIDGNIFVEIKSTKEELEIIIEDTGIGISYDDQNRIFERFYMVDKSRSFNKKSTGLGLAIVKNNVENLQGSIELKSQINQGTKFILKFPKKEYRKSQ